MALLAGRVLRDVLTLTVQAIVLVLAGLAFGLRAPLGGVLIGLGFVAVVAVSLSAVSYAVGLLLKSEDALAPLLNMVMVPLMLLSGIMLPMTLGPQWLRDVAKATPFGYIINAMRDAFAGHYFNVDHASRASRLGRPRDRLPVAGQPRLHQGERLSLAHGRARRGQGGRRPVHRGGAGASAARAARSRSSARSTRPAR